MISQLEQTLVQLAHEFADVPLLAQTHGQPASPTTLGKEFAVMAHRLGRAKLRVARVVATHIR